MSGCLPNINIVGEPTTSSNPQYSHPVCYNPPATPVNETKQNNNTDPSFQNHIPKKITILKRNASNSAKTSKNLFI